MKQIISSAEVLSLIDKSIRQLEMISGNYLPPQKKFRKALREMQADLRDCRAYIESLPVIER